MENQNTLDHLLQIETRALALVNEAQAEADRRIHESEEKNQAAYEERFNMEVQVLEDSLEKEKVKIHELYKNELEEYRKEILKINADMDGFSSLLNECIRKE